MTYNQTHKSFLFLSILLVSFFLVSCEGQDTRPSDIEGYNSGIETILNDEVYAMKVSNPLTDDSEDIVDHALNDFKADNTAVVILDDYNTVINNAVDDTNIYMENGNLIVDSTKKMTLILKGTLHGSVIVNKPDGKFKLVLDGVDIESESGPAINIQSEKRAFLVLNSGTVNNITDGTEHPTLQNGSNTNGAIFSEEQLIISGSGELNITARYKHGIVSDDYIKIISGTINILSSRLDGLHANDYIVIDGGIVTINAGSNGIECEKGYIVINGGIIDITSVNDGIKTSYHDIDRDSFIHINHGILAINAQKEGITATSNIILIDGAVIILSVDDAISADGYLSIVDGLYYFRSVDKQALDGDVYVEIIGGTMMLLSDGETATIESDEGDIAINGGLVVAGGPIEFDLTDSEQGYILYGPVVDNDIINIKGTTSYLTAAFLKGYDSVIFSSPEMTPGSTVDVYTLGTIQGDNFYGIYLNGTYSNGSLDESITIE